MKRCHLFLLLLPQILLAQPQPWMKATDPDNLVVLFEVGDRCPDNAETYESIIDGVLVRSRIRPTIVARVFVARTDDNGQIVDYVPHPYLMHEELFLKVSLDCGPHDSAYLYHVNVHFAVLKGNRDVLLYDRPYWASFGRFMPDGIRSALKEKVEQAITDYIKANVDLKETDQ